MSKLNNMKIGKRLKLSFIGVLIICSLGSVAGAILMNYADTKYSNALIDYGFSQGEIGMALQYITESKVSLQKILYFDDEAALENTKKNLTADSSSILDSLEKVEKSLNDNTERSIYADITKNIESYMQYESRILDYMTAGNKDAAIKLYNTDAEPVLDKAIESSLTLLTTFVETGTQLSERLTTQSIIMIITIVLLLVCSAVVSLMLASNITKGINTPIQEILLCANEIANGNLNVDVTVSTQDELGELGQAFRNTVSNLSLYINDITNTLDEIGKGNLTTQSNVAYQGSFIVIEDTLIHILENLNDTLSGIDNASSMLSSGSEQIASASQALSDGAMDQASSVEELNATLTEVEGQINDTAANAADANLQAISVGGSIGQSNQMMQQMMEAMSEINTSSRQIAGIMTLIEDIASQTNLLSLNAAIEAARAGDAGKGFAVVANEIRSLAAQSADAAKNTRGLIEASINALDKGTKIADKTADSLNTVVSGAAIITEKIEQISDASKKQAQSIKEISTAADTISGVIQNNSATAQESAASSEELSSQAQVLKSLISNFKLKN